MIMATSNSKPISKVAQSFKYILIYPAQQMLPKGSTSFILQRIWKQLACTTFPQICVASVRTSTG